jgi:hypothetical protein
MAWGTYRRGRHLSIQLPTETYQRLVNDRARGAGSITEQVLSALRAKWDTIGIVTPAQPYTPPQRLGPPGLAPGTTLYNGQVYKVQRPNDPKIPKWNL